MTGEADGVVLRVKRLHERLSRKVAASGASRHLGEQLKRPLGRAEIAIGNAKADLQVSSQSFGNGTTSQRVMVGIKIPF